MAEWQTGKLRLLAKVSQLNPFFVVDEDEVGDATVAIDDDAEGCVMLASNELFKLPNCHYDPKDLDDLSDSWVSPRVSLDHSSLT